MSCASGASLGSPVCYDGVIALVFKCHAFTSPSISLPEKLEYFANKYAEHSHDKWSAEKVSFESSLTFSVNGIYKTEMMTFIDVCAMCVCA